MRLWTAVFSASLIAALSLGNGMPGPCGSPSAAAPQIVSVPGLVRNMWSLDPDSGLGTSVYLFDSEDGARHFLAGATLEHLLNGPGISGVAFDLAPVDGAGPGMIAAPGMPAPSRAAS